MASFCLLLPPLASGRDGLGDPLKLSKNARAKASELLKKYKSLSDDLEARGKVLDELLELGLPVAKVMHGMLDREWEAALERYTRAFKVQSGALAKEKLSKANRAKVDELAARVRGLRNDGGLTKAKVKATGDPAVKQLKSLSRVDPAEVASSSEKIMAERKRIVALAEQWSASVEEMLLTDTKPFREKDLRNLETNIASEAIPMDSTAREVLNQNEKLAKEIRPEEAEGVRDLNQLRMLIGLRPVLIDVALCEASRGHSKDMAEKRFFSHDSPVQGKETPWRRAKLEGTTASAENIFAGSGDPRSANKAWWYSPGHHKNMLSPGQKRIGLGHHGGRWTQMFGR